MTIFMRISLSFAIDEHSKKLQNWGKNRNLFSKEIKNFITWFSFDFDEISIFHEDLFRVFLSLFEGWNGKIDLPSSQIKSDNRKINCQSKLPLPQEENLSNCVIACIEKLLICRGNFNGSLIEIIKFL